MKSCWICLPTSIKTNTRMQRLQALL